MDEKKVEITGVANLQNLASWHPALKQAYSAPDTTTVTIAPDIEVDFAFVQALAAYKKNGLRFDWQPIPETLSLIKAVGFDSLLSV